MNKKIIGISVATVLAAVLGLGAYWFYFQDKGALSYKDATYIIDGKSVTLRDGVAETAAAPGAASKTITRYFGNAAKGDFDGDGREDIAFLLTQETGGSGTFFYVVAALNTEKGYFGTEGRLLGDRIAPQTSSVEPGGIILVNYVVRNPGEAFTVRPSLGKSIWLLLDVKTMKLGEVGKNLENAAAIGRMTLGMKTWEWVSTLYTDNKEIKPRAEKKFILTFKDKNTFSVTTDCNTAGGEYVVSGNKISFGKIFSTKMYCEGSQEGDFLKMLEEAQNYLFTGRGGLILGLKFDSGSIILR
jgi:heat shock protein HslJ